MSRVTPGTVRNLAVLLLFINLSSCRSKQIISFCEPFLYSKNHHIAEMELGAIAATGKEGVLYLTEGLYHPDWRIRKLTITRLAKDGGPETADSILPLLFDESGSVVLTAAKTLIEQGNNNPYLFVAALNHHPWEWVRADIAKTAGDLNHPIIIERLIKLLVDPSPRVRISAAQSLGKIGSPEAGSALIKLLSCRSANVFKAATTAVAQLKPPPVKKLLQEVRSNNVRAQLGATLALMNIPDTKERGLTLFRAMLRRGYDPRLKNVIDQVKLRKEFSQTLAKDIEQYEGHRQHFSKDALVDQKFIAGVSERIKTRNLNEVLGVLNRTLRLDPHHLEALRLKARALLTLSRHQEALEVINRALFVDPVDIASLKIKGRILQTLNRQSELMELWFMARDFYPPESKRGLEDFLWKESN